MNPKLLAVRLKHGDPLYYFDDNLDGSYSLELPYSSDSTVQVTPSGYRRSFRAGGEEIYDSAGRIVSAADAAGVATTYTRDGSGRLTSVATRGRSVTVTYSGTSTRPYQLIGPGSVVLATYAYDVSNRLDTVTYGDGSGYHYFYDGGGRVVRVEDAAGLVLETHAYDGQGRAITSERGQGIDQLVLSYGSDQTTITDALGRATTYTFANVRGIKRVTKATGLCESCGGAGEVQEWTYDAFGRIATHKDADNKVTSYTYNANGDRLTETDPLNHTTTYTYDAQGRVLTATAADTGVTTLTHGPAGPLTVSDPLSHVTTMTYNGQGKPDSITDPRNKTTTLTYDAVTADLLSVADPLNHSTAFGYDPFGRRTTVTDALSHTTTTAYDSQGRVTRITSHDGTFTEFTYNISGQRTVVTDPLGRKTRYAYDSAGRLEAVLDAAEGMTRYGYDAMSNLTSLTDARSQTTRFEYDDFNRVKKVKYPGGGEEQFTYDVVGRLKTKTDRKGVVTTYTYDAVGRLLGKSYSDGVTPAVSFTYDSVGRMLTAANGTDTLTWTYDLAGQLLSEQSTKNASMVAYTYDAGGDRLNVSLDGTVFLTYAYDDASRLTTITRGSNAFTFSHDDANRRTSMTYPNGVTTSYVYDTLSRLTNVGASLGATPVTSFAYAYDAAGNRSSKTTPDLAETYGYDDLYRLTEVGRTGAQTDETFYTYDTVGNGLSKQVGQAVVSSLYDAGNRLVSASGGGPLRIRGHLSERGTATVNGQPARMSSGNVFDATISSVPGTNTVIVTATDPSGNVKANSWTVDVAAAGTGYTYDPNGNLTQKIEGNDTWTYEWDAENQLKRVLKNAAEVARFAYDALGRRVEKVAGGVTVTYTYDNDDILREARGSTTLKYIHGLETDEPLAREDGTAMTYYHADGLRSITTETTQAGTVSQSRRYDQWGQVQAGGTEPGYAFTGREWDPETGLYYYRARYYDPVGGRFLSPDPLEFDAGWNFYEYALSNPTNLIDPTGLAVRTVNCGRRSGVVKAAASLADAGSQRCVPDKHRPACRRTLRNLTVVCVPWTREPDTKQRRRICGRAMTQQPGNVIQITPAAFTNPGCGCLQSTILHEALHLLRTPDYPDDHRGDKDSRWDPEDKCFSCGN